MIMKYKYIIISSVKITKKLNYNKFLLTKNADNIRIFLKTLDKKADIV